MEELVQDSEIWYRERFTLIFFHKTGSQEVCIIPKSFLLMQDGLVEGPARVNDVANFRVLNGIFAAQHNEVCTGWNAIVTVQLQKVNPPYLKR